MHAVEVSLILILNLTFIFILYRYQKRLVEKSMRHLKEEIQELEDLVAAIIEEFQEIAAINENNSKSAAILPGKRELGAEYPTVDEFLDNLNDNDMIGEPSAAVRNINDSTAGVNSRAEKHPKTRIHYAEVANENTMNEAEYQTSDPLPDDECSGSKTENTINPEFISDPKHREIFDLWQQGLSVEEIARRLGKGRGEIQLVLGIYRRS